MTLDEALTARPTATDAELAEQFGCSAKTVSRARKRRGIPPPPAILSPDAPSPEQLAAARALLLSGGSLRAVSADTGVSIHRLRSLRSELESELGSPVEPTLRGRPRTRVSVALSRSQAADLERQAALEGVSVEELVRKRALGE